MTYEEIKYQILLNRKSLADLYACKTYYKGAKNRCDEQGLVNIEYKCHNELKRLTKEIAKLVSLQQSLKQEAAEKILEARFERWLDSVEGQAFGFVEDEV